jgi:putative tricarboxylic transport membrane protein
MGAVAPLLTLGIPGAGPTAILLGGLMMWGLRPGPMLFKDNPDFVWGLIGSMYVGNVICLIISMLCIPILVQVVRVPLAVMIPAITVVCIIGTYSTSNSMFEVWFMVCAGIIGYLLDAHKYPSVPLILGFVLTPMLEKFVRQAFEISLGSPMIFIQKPIALTLIVITIAIIVVPSIMKKMNKGEVFEMEKEAE